MRAYKYVDLDVADCVSQGSLKIGTLEAYASLEGVRRDASEATITKVVSEMFIKDSESEKDKVAILQSMGVRVRNSSNISISNIQNIVKYPNSYTFCMSMRRDNQRLISERPQAVFEITGVRCLAEEISKQNNDKIGSWRIGSVSYQERKKEIKSFVESQYFLPDPFIKDAEFSEEEEIRIIWNPKTNIISPFFTKENIGLSQYIRRVA